MIKTVGNPDAQESIRELRKRYYELFDRIQELKKQMVEIDYQIGVKAGYIKPEENEKSEKGENTRI